MKEYKYESPLTKGFVKIYLPRKFHKEIFPRRKLTPFIKYDYYLSDNAVIIEQYANLLGKICTLLLFPLIVFMVGIKEAVIEVKRTLFQQKYGSFSVDCTFNKKTRDLVLYKKG